MIKTATLGRNDYIIMQVHDEAYDFEMRRNNELVYLLKGVINPLTGSEKSEILNIPDARWGMVVKDYKILGTVSDIAIDERLCRDIVEVHSITRLSQFGYKDYVKSTEQMQDYTITKATESFATLLTSLELELSKQWVMLKKTINENIFC